MEITSIGGPLILFLLMMLIGLELTLDDFRRVLASPRAVVGGTLGQWILLPLMTWLVVWAVGVNPIFGAGAVLVAVSPGAGISNVFAALGRANLALSVTLTATTSVFAVLTLPTIASLGMRLFLGDEVPVDVPVGTLIGQLLLTLLVPITLGMLLRARDPERARVLAPRLQAATLGVMLLVVGLGVAFAPEEQRSFEGGGRALFAAGVWTLLAMGLGWGVAALLRLPSRDRFTFLIEFSARNIAVAAIVAMSGLDRVDLTFFSGVYAAVGYPLAGVAVVLRRRYVARAERDEAA